MSPVFCKIAIKTIDLDNIRSYIFKKLNLLMLKEIKEISNKDKCCEFIRINDAQVNYFVIKKKSLKCNNILLKMGSQPKMLAIDTKKNVYSTYKVIIHHIIYLFSITQSIEVE